MTPNVEKLKKLRDIVAAIPDNHFAMDGFFRETDRLALSPSSNEKTISELVTTCGSVGCVVGWGAMDKDLNPKRFHFNEFSGRVLGIPTYDRFWDALFGGEWGTKFDFHTYIVEPEQQKEDALDRLSYVIDQLEADPAWVGSARFDDWVEETMEDLNAITQEAEPEDEEEEEYEEDDE